MLAHVYEYDIILLDIVLPKKNGFQVAIELRREGRNTPILMLTSRDAVEDVVRGLDAGADDYLAKPFRFDELLARIRALHRRGGAERLEVLRYGPITLDRLRHALSVNDATLDLTPKEFQLLEYFLLHPEEVVRRTTLLEKVWDMHFDPESNVVDVHVGNLRRKLSRGGRRAAARDGPRGGIQPAPGRPDGSQRRAAADRPRRRRALRPAPFSASSRGLALRYTVGPRPALLLWTVGLAITGMPVVWTHPPRRAPRGASPRISSPPSPSSARCSWSQPLAGLIVVLMQTGGEALERYAEGRASAAVRELEAAAPRIAHRLDRGEPRTSPVDAVEVGDLLLVRPGELVPCDVEVVDGSSSVDTSRLTGEPMPVAARPGSRLLSGSLNLDGVAEGPGPRAGRREPVRADRGAGPVRAGQQVSAPATRRSLRRLVHPAHPGRLWRRLVRCRATPSACSPCSWWPPHAR